MNAEVLRGLLRRLGVLERTSVRYRQGVVTATAPLSIALGGSNVPYTDVAALAAAAPLAVDDVVSVLVFGNDLLVLGRPAGADRLITLTGTVTWNGSSKSSPAVIAHGLPVTPSVVAMCQSQAGIGDHWTYVDSVDAANVVVRVQTTGYTPPTGTTAPVVVLATV